MRVLNFSEDQVGFIKKGTGINIPANKDVVLKKEQAEIIIDYSFDVESDEVLKADDNTDISPFGRLASSIIDMITIKSR